MKRSEKYQALWKKAFERAKNFSRSIQFDVNLSPEYLRQKRQAARLFYIASRIYDKYTKAWLKENN